MTPGQRRFNRRALLVGAAGTVGAAVVVEAIRVADDGSPQGDGQPAAPSQTEQVNPGGESVDLTVRWRHLERRVADPTLLAGWQFDEGSGYAFDDVSGNEHTLYVTGMDWNTSDSGLASAIHRRGLRGGAVYLDGTRWLAAAPSAALTPRTGLTVSCRVRLDALPAGSTVILGFADSYVLSVASTGSMEMSVTDRSGSRRVVTSPAGSVTVGRWAQLTASVSPRTGALRLYVDGRQLASSAGQPFAMPTTVASLIVGGLLRGSVDEVTIHRVPLTADQVANLCIVGTPTVYTQTSESIDPARSVFTLYKGSEPVPHPVISTTVFTQRFANSTRTDQGGEPVLAPARPVFVPGAFGGAWRATDSGLTYPSPLSGDSGSFEAWYEVIDDPADPRRVQRKEIFTASGGASSLALFTESGRWQAELRHAGGPPRSVAAGLQLFTPGVLEHVAMTWGLQAGGHHGVALYVNGVPAGLLSTEAGQTSYTSRIGLGGTSVAPTYALLTDVRISDVALPWGEICPRGQASTDAAGLDLRDRFDRPPGSAPMLWRTGSSGGAWSHRRKTWEHPEAVGADPASVRALFQDTSTGLRAAFHPDAFGRASSIEAGVAFPTSVDGWAGVFVQGGRPQDTFSGVTLMLNPDRGQLRLALFKAGRMTSVKTLGYDFALAAQATYEVTLTSAGDGIVRGFVDGSNLISMRVGEGWPDRGFAGMLTQDTQAFFSDLHFCALTPAAPVSRVIRTRVIRYGAGAEVGAIGLTPFRWHKRRGLLPWQYTFKNPEPAGNIAGAATSLPLRPIPAAAWRAEDSANTDLVTLGSRMFLIMRGNPRIDNRQSVARVGVLHVDVAKFDGIHFTDPNIPAARVVGGTVLVSGTLHNAQLAVAPGAVQLNEPSTGYVGGRRLVFFGRESTVPTPGEARVGQLVYSRFDVVTGAWEHEMAQPLPWSHAGPLSITTPPTEHRDLHGTPEIVILREPDADGYQGVIFQQTASDGHAVMATAVLDNMSAGVPALAPDRPVRTSIARGSGGPIYGFRVLFDNGIYYLHYNEGPEVPDWPDRFVLAATLDPYAGPWVVNSETTRADSTYFRRGLPLEPDNGAIWQGTMVKHRGCYYLYYENYHSIDRVDQQYEDYANPQAGSRVGFATA